MSTPPLRNAGDSGGNGPSSPEQNPAPGDDERRLRTRVETE